MYVFTENTSFTYKMSVVGLIVTRQGLFIRRILISV